MADYPINKGIGHSVEFKGLKAQYLFIFCRWTACRLLPCGSPLYGRCGPTGLHRLGSHARIIACMGNIPPEQQVRRAWTDEAPCRQEPPTLYPQPKENKPNVQT